MRLSDAIGLQAADALACVGAGGKTSLCWRLWLECCVDGRTPVFTTSTHILEPTLPPWSALLLARAPNSTRVCQLAAATRGLILAAARLPERVTGVVPNPIAPTRDVKLEGLPPEQLDRLILECPGITWLIEADGARGRSLKLPSEHEPAIPSRSSIVCVMAHLDAVGQPLGGPTAHRPERLAQYLRVGLEHVITGDDIIALMTDPAGGLKNIPATSRAVAVLNQHDEGQLHPAAPAVAHALRQTGRYERVVVASLRAERPVLEVHVA